uniref:Envelope glycoprotein n=1 Tax=Pelusios castaneus TaxID=367368 RepID=A0A8C8RZ87_9SAUR
MLNRIIRLQAAVKIITNETASALNLIAEMNSKMRTAIYQNRLALDYLLAKEGGVCGKFNLTNCCLEIDDTGQAIKEITNDIRKLAHVPVQTWKGLDTSGWFGGWFDWLGGFKSVIGIVLMLSCACLVLPCLLPVLISGVRNSISRIARQATTSQLMTLYRFQHVQNDEEEPLNTLSHRPTPT